VTIAAFALFKSFRPVKNQPSYNTASLTVGGRPAALLRSAADYAGYADVMGFARALDIWKAREYAEEACDLCARKRR
jgi:hypothetical protein